MNTEKVFIGYINNKNNKFEEHLLYRKDDNTYIDLLSKDSITYDKNIIDTTKLIPFRVIKDKKRMFKILVKRKYINDRKQIMKLDKIYYGAVYKVTNLKKSYYGNTSSLLEYFLTAGVYANYISDPVYTSLFIQKNDDEYIDLVNNDTILLRDSLRADEIENGMYHVIENRLYSLNNIINNYNCIYKKKREIMEFYQEIDFEVKVNKFYKDNKILK